jgi:PAS domain S-box-containing protein
VRWIFLRNEAFPGPDGEPLRIITAQQDITELVTAREALAVRQQELEQRVAERTAALAEAEGRFRGIFDSQFQYISLLAPDGTILEVNRTALDAGGASRDEAVGKRLWETRCWPDAARDQLRSDIAQASRGTMIRHEIEAISASGRVMRLDFSLKPVLDPVSGCVTSLIAEGRDLTERYNLTAQLVQSQKVQALGQLAGGIAHDFNNILQTVSGAAALIQQEPGDADRTRSRARTAMTAASRGTSITQRLLSFARRGDLRAAVIDTAEMLSNVTEVLAHTLGTSITVSVDIPPDVPALIADQAQLETALINLGTNARDAMPDGGTLLLSARAEHVAEGADHPAGLVAGDYVRLSFADTGTGMDAATLTRASEPFFTTKAPGRGTGLGLAMARGFAEQSGGALSIASAPGRGTTVVMWLRQASGEAPRVRKDVPSARVASGVSARVLVVDDDEGVRETVADQLDAAGFVSLVAASGVEALALIEAGEPVDAMVSDLSMPGISGVTTIQKVHALRPQMPCFLLTGYVGESAAFSREDDFTLVRKPVTGPVLAALIEAALEGARP